MAAAYAALVSLMNTMDHIQDHPRLSNCFDKKQMESLSHHLSFLLDFVEIPHSHGVLSNEDEVLESQIASAAYAAEDVIESHVVDQIHSGSLSLLDLQTLIQDVGSVKDKVANVKEEGRFEDRQHGPTYSLPAHSPSTSSNDGKMVGFDEELIELLDALTAQQSSLQIIPIVGMGGIGKTTLARNAYENRLTLDHFVIRAWVTISQEYSVREIFSKLLSRQSSQSADEQQLGQELYQSLIGRRYLIILDDIWSLDVWDKIKFFFPDNNNQSRIILTTRMSNVAVHFGSSYFSLKFLDEDKSWKLFSENAFLQEGCCPPEFEQIGKKTVKKCRGLPLLIVVIGRLLRQSSRTLELWESVSKDINLIPNLSEEEQHLDILSLSYSHLPAKLKPCFLYMGIFPEDHEIRVSEVIKLWVAEGFIKPNQTQSLEEVAERYLKDLIDRNLLLVGRLRNNGKIKSCTIHDLLRDMCIKAAQKEKFLYLIEFCDSPLRINKERRILFHEKISEVNSDPLLSHTLVSTSLTRSLLGKGDWVPSKFRLLRVFNVVDRDSSLNDIFNQVNLRFVCKSLPNNYERISHELHSSISLLWNVQTLKIRGRHRFVAPSEIWSIPQLRHLDFTEICLPEPPLRSQENEDRIVLKNLQTLKTTVNLELSEEVCKRIPNVKKLNIQYNDLSGKSLRDNCLYYIGRLHKLESLNLSRGNLVRDLKFPTSLQRLTLKGSNLDWEDLAAIGSLPNLEVLKLLYCPVRGLEWNPIEGGFLRLKYLFISFLWELKYWNAESVHFPVLENLFLYSFSKLDEIPIGIGDIPTLQVIHVIYCTESAAISAMRILEVQQSLGNDHLRLYIRFMQKEELERFKEKVDNFESFSSNNLLLASDQ